MKKFLLYVAMVTMPGVQHVLAQLEARQVPPGFVSSTGFEARWILNDGVENGYASALFIDIAATSGTSFTNLIEPYSDLNITEELHESIGDVHDFDVGGLLPNTTYAWRLRVVSNQAQTTYSAVQHVTTKSHPQNSAPAEWLKTFEDPGESYFVNVTSDEAGNIFATAVFENSMTIGSTTLTTLTNYGVGIAKFDADGVPQWFKKIASETDLDWVYVKYYDGHFYLAGTTGQTIDMDPGSGVQNIEGDFFLAKYRTSDGSLVWVKSLEGDEVYIRSLGVGATGIVLVGEFHQSADFDPGAGSQVRIASYSGFVSSYSLDGIFQWVGTIDGSGSRELVQDVVVNDDYVYITGGTQGGDEIDIDPTVSEDYVGGSGFVVKLNSATGVYVWGRPSTEFGESLVDLGSSVLLLGRSNLFMVAEYSKSLGNVVTVKALELSDGNANSRFHIRSVVTYDNTVYIGGEITGSVDFNSPSGGGERSIDPSESVSGFTNGSRAFVTAYDYTPGSIQFRWAKTYPGAITDVETDYVGEPVLVANSQGLYLAGYFGGNIDFDPYDGSLLESGDDDAFIVKYDIGQEPPAPPVAPVASAATAVQSTSFIANWNSVAEAAYYKIDVALEGQGFQDFITGYNGTIVQSATQVLVTGLVPLTQYEYRVRAISADGASVNSNIITVTAGSGALPPPANFHPVFVSNTGFGVEFNHVPGALEYRMDLSTDNFATFVNGNENILLNTSDYPGWNFVGLQPSSDFQVRIRTVNAFGAGANSPTLVVTTHAHPAQVSSSLWVQSFGSATEEFVTAIASDPDGNMYVTGKTSELAITIGGITLSPIGGSDVFIAKFNSAGVTQWAKRVGGSLADEGWHIVADASGVYVSGAFGGTADFDPDGGVTNLVGNGNSPHLDYDYLDDGFIAKYDLSDGSLHWAKSLGNYWPYAGGGKSLYADGEALFATGVFVGVNDFDPDAGTFNLTSAGSNDIFLGRFNRWTGVLDWGLSLGSEASDNSVTITGDYNTLYLAGTHRGAIDLDPGPGTQNVTGPQGTFISRFGKNGVFQWTQSFQPTDQSNGQFFGVYDMALDNDNIYFVGNFYGEVDVDPNAGTHNLVSGYTQGFGVKLGKGGDYLWSGQVRTFSPEAMRPTRVIADEAGIYVVGYSSWSADFDPGPGEANRAARSGDIFVTRYNGADGSFQWAKTVGSWGFDFPRSAAALTNDGLYIGGGFLQTANFNPYLSPVERTSAGGIDGFIAKYASTSPAQPDAPVQFTPSFVSNTGVRMDWQEVPGALNYRVDISTDNFATFEWDDTPIATGGMPGRKGWTWTPLQPNTTYQMRIRAIGSGGLISLNSNVVEFTTKPHPVQAAPNIWTSTFGSAAANETIASIATDASGNVYAIGNYRGDFTLGTTTLTNGGMIDVFFAKYSPAGAVLWVKSLSSPEEEVTFSVAVDATGFYITGYYKPGSNLDFDPNIGVQLISSVGSTRNGYIAKYSLADGSFIWAKPLNNSWSFSGASMKADGTGVYVTGVFIGTNDFDPGAGSVTRTSVGSEDVYLARYSAADGNLVWVSTFGGAANDTGNSVMLDGSFVYTSGQVEFGGDLDPGPNTTNLFRGSYFSKFNAADGSLVWAKPIEGAEYAFDLAKNATDLFVAGSFSGTVDFDPGAGTQSLHSGFGHELSESGYVARYNLTDGEFLAVKAMMANGSFHPRRIIADNNGYYIGGYGMWGVDFDPGIGEDSRHAFWEDAVLARYTTGGELVWAKMIGSDYRQDQIVGGLAVSADGLYAAGGFGGTVNFDPYVNVHNATSNGQRDGFLAKYQIEASVPAVPTALAATDETASGFTANWFQVANAANYRLDVSTSDSFVNFLPGFHNLTIAQLNKEITGLDPGTTYYYQVRAVNDGGASPNSNVISVTTSAVALAAPEAEAANAISATAFMAAWNAVVSATSYQLDVSADDFVTYVPGYQSRSVNATSEGVLGLSAQTQYKYRVRAVGSGGTSANSNVVSITMLSNPPNAPAASPPTLISTSGFTANWNTVANATGYKLEVSADNFVTFLPDYNGKTLLGTSEPIVGLTGGKSYQYRVTATNAGGSSSYSNVIVAVTLAHPPAPVAAEATSINVSSFVATWSSVAGATSYRLDVSSDTFINFVAGYDDKAVSATTETVTGLTAGTSYKFRVRAESPAGTSVNSEEVTVATLELSAPLALAASNVGTNSFTASWDPSLGATSYLLYVSADNFVSFVPGFNGVSIVNTSAVVVGLNPNTAYKYKVRAFSPTSTSNDSNIILVSTLLPPPVAPTAQSATNVTTTGFTANWNSAATATGYRLDVSDDNFVNFVSGYFDKSVNGTSALVTGLDHSSGYQYRVRAENGSGASPNSNVIGVSTLVPLPDAPGAMPASNVAPTSFIANWNSVATASSYRLDVSADNFVNFVTGYADKEVDATFDMVTGLNPSTAYKYRVRAVDPVGTSANSNIISVTTQAKQNQTITFAAIDSKTIGGPGFALAATASSALEVTFTATTDHTTVNGVNVTMVRPGKATITANQAGNAVFNAAPAVVREFCINPAKPTIGASDLNTEEPVLTSSSTSGNQWFRDNIPIVDATQTTYHVTVAGVYTVRVTIETCSSEMSEAKAIIVTGDIARFGGNRIVLAPNPVEKELLIQMRDTGNKEILIYSASGVLAKTLSSSRDEERVDVSSFAGGLYIVKIVSESGSYAGQFIKK